MMFAETYHCHFPMNGLGRYHVCPDICSGTTGNQVSLEPCRAQKRQSDFFGHADHMMCAIPSEGSESECTSVGMLRQECRRGANRHTRQTMPLSK